jgi:hypothetical protein
VRRLADDLAARVAREAGPGAGKQVDRAYRIALGRPPDAVEARIGRESLAVLTARWARHLPGPARHEAARRALASYCHTLLNSAAFLYVD